MKRWMGLWVLINLLLLVPVGNHVSAARITGVTETDGCLQTVSVLPDMAVADAWLMAASYDMQNGTLLDVTIERAFRCPVMGKNRQYNWRDLCQKRKGRASKYSYGMGIPCVRYQPRLSIPTSRPFMLRRAAMTRTRAHWICRLLRWNGHGMPCAIPM